MLILRSDDAWMLLVDLAVVEDEMRHEGLSIVTLGRSRTIGLLVGPGANGIDGSMACHRGPPRLAAAHLRCVRSTATDISAAVKLDKLVEAVATDAVLSQQVGGIGVAVNFPQVDTAQPHRLLDPERVGVEVTKLAQALPGTNPNRSA